MFRNEASGSDNAMKRLMGAQFSPQKPFLQIQIPKVQNFINVFTSTGNKCQANVITWEEKKLRFESDEEATMGRS